MSKTYSVALYALSVIPKKKGKKDDKEPEPLKLSEVIDNGKTFHDFLEKYLEEASQKMFDDTKTETHLRIHRHEKHNGGPCYIDGVIESGESGSSQKLYHIEKKSERTKLAKEANLDPFYFCFRETNDPEFMAMCLQRLGNQGIKTQVVKSLQSVFREVFPDHILRIEDHLPEFYRKRFFENNLVKKVEYTYFGNLRDVASRLEADGERDMQRGEAIIRLSIQPNRGFLHKFRNGLNKPVREILSGMKPEALNIADDKLIDTSVTLCDADGKTRTFRTSQNRDILPYIDVTGQVKRNDEGHPDFEDMRNVVTLVLVNAKLIDKDG